MSPRPVSASSGGYTLIEVLAVAVLLGLVAALGVPPMLRAMHGDPAQRAADRLATAFRDTRALGFGRRLDLGLEAWGYAVAGTPAVRLPDGLLVLWSRDGRPVRRLQLDGRGHGPDTDVTVQAAGRDLAFTIDGLTGAWTAKARP